MPLKRKRLGEAVTWRVCVALPIAFFGPEKLRKNLLVQVLFWHWSFAVLTLHMLWGHC